MAEVIVYLNKEYKDDFCVKYTTLTTREPFGWFKHIGYYVLTPTGMVNVSHSSVRGKRIVHLDKDKLACILLLPTAESIIAFLSK